MMGARQPYISTTGVAVTDLDEDDTSNIVPVLVHMDRKDWEQFKLLAGKRRASARLRAMVKRELIENSVAATR